MVRIALQNATCPQRTATRYLSAESLGKNTRVWIFCGAQGTFAFTAAGWPGTLYPEGLLEHAAMNESWNAV